MKLEIVPIVRKLYQCQYGDIVKFTGSGDITHTCLVMYGGMVSLNDPESTWFYNENRAKEYTVVGNYEVELIGRLKFSK